jgi:TolA-binding protein
LNFSLCQKQNRIDTLEAFEEEAADLHGQVELLEDIRRQNEATVAELRQQLSRLRAEVNTANGHRLQQATTVRRLQDAVMYNANEAIESPLLGSN